MARGKPYLARTEYETALGHFADHAGAIVGLSNILLDMYTEKLLPPPAVPGLDLGALTLTEESMFAPTASTNNTDATTTSHVARSGEDKFPSLPSAPLGLGPTRAKATAPPCPGDAKVNGLQPAAAPDPTTSQPATASPSSPSSLLGPPLPPPHRATSLPANDRLAARDRAYGLLSGLTKLGTGWDDSEAWLALARAYEESGQADRARDALWWCVELEDGRGVREWSVAGVAGYFL